MWAWCMWVPWVQGVCGGGCRWGVYVEEEEGVCGFRCMCVCGGEVYIRGFRVYICGGGYMWVQGVCGFRVYVGVGVGGCV